MLDIKNAHTNDVQTVAFSSKDEYIASGSYDFTVKIWDTKTGKEMQVLYGHSAWVRKVCFSKNGEFLASGSSDKTIKIWTKIKNDKKEVKSERFLEKMKNFELKSQK